MAHDPPMASFALYRVAEARPTHELTKLLVSFFRPFNRCRASFIVVCIVAWDGMPKHEADNSYRLLVHKLNKFGLPTTRRCATNENRTCACQGNLPSEAAHITQLERRAQLSRQRTI